MPLVEAALGGLALLGLANALYFTAVTYRWVRPDPRWLPRPLCMDEQTCARVVDTPQARLLFGVPNSVLGAAWYVLVLAAAGQALATGAVPPSWCLPLLAASLATVAMSAYLAWVLLARLRTPCALCFLGHGVNAALLVLLSLACLT